MSGEEEARKDLGDLWTNTFKACAAQDALEREESANDLRKLIIISFEPAKTAVQLVAFGMLSTEPKMASVDDFYIALGRCCDTVVLEEVLSWLDMK
jgi:hypothetical protein